MPDIRVPRRRRFLVCEPRHFAVQYAINPWMHPDLQVDVDLARDQWQSLIHVYRDHGHTVDTVEPVPGLPDMVFAANSAVVVDGRVFGSLFHAPERRPESLTTRRGSRRPATPSIAPSPSARARATWCGRAAMCSPAPDSVRPARRIARSRSSWATR